MNNEVGKRNKKKKKAENWSDLFLISLILIALQVSNTVDTRFQAPVLAASLVEIN